MRHRRPGHHILSFGFIRASKISFIDGEASHAGEAITHAHTPSRHPTSNTENSLEEQDRRGFCDHSCILGHSVCFAALENLQSCLFYFSFSFLYLIGSPLLCQCISFLGRESRAFHFPDSFSGIPGKVQARTMVPLSYGNGGVEWSLLVFFLLTISPHTHTHTHLQTNEWNLFRQIN